MVKEVIGFDPAYINYAVCKIRFETLRYDRKEDGTIEEMPVFTVSNMEVWNLRDSRVIRNSVPDGGNAETYYVPNSLIHPTKINEWLAALNHIILRSPWLSETYCEEEGKEAVLPRVTIEVQCDHIKDHRFDMFRIGNATETSIHMSDLCRLGVDHKKLLTRQMGRSARKYGFKSDGSLEYKGRKGISIEIVRALFTALKLDNWLVYLDSVLKMGQKIDDLCDALLLALHVAIEEYEAKQKKLRTMGPDSIDYSLIDNTTYPKLISSILNGVTEFDIHNDDSDDDEPKNTQKKKTPTKRKNTSANDETVPKKRKYTKKNKEKEKEDENILVIDDDDDTPKQKRKALPKEKENKPRKRTKKSD